MEREEKRVGEGKCDDARINLRKIKKKGNEEDM